MDASGKTAITTTGNNNFLQWCKKIWLSIITIGITNQLTAWEQKRTRLLNGVAAMALIILSIYCLLYLSKTEHLVLIESFQGVVAMAIVLLLNHFHKYIAACHFFNIYNMLCYSFFAISHGKVDAAEYILVAGSIASMLFFRDRVTVITYFILNAACFAACKYSFTVIQPFLFMPNGENLYFANHVTLFIILFLIVFYFKSENEQQEGLLEQRNRLLQKEKEKSDNLLLNILPAETAEELKETGEAAAKSYKMVTVLFLDFKDFTYMAEAMPAEELVNAINYYFSAFDTIIQRHDIEKIKTIGDAYMCAGGLPQANHTNPIDVVLAALEIQEFMQQDKQQKQQQNKPCFEIRIGINSGSIIAGIVGIKKFAYDIWGDTVNIAARMESSGIAGKVNISGATYELVKDAFNCTHRGKIEAKHKGMIDMYFVESARESANKCSSPLTLQ
jgi:class 3 adenylate cyclase